MNFLHRQRVLAVRVVTSDLSGNEMAVGGIVRNLFIVASRKSSGNKL